MYTISLVAVRVEEDDLQLQTHTVGVSKDTAEEAALYAMLFVMNDATKDFGDRPDAVRIVNVQEGDVGSVEMAKEYLDLGRALTEIPEQVSGVLDGRSAPAQMPA